MGRGPKAQVQSLIHCARCGPALRAHWKGNRWGGKGDRRGLTRAANCLPPPQLCDPPPPPPCVCMEQLPDRGCSSGMMPNEVRVGARTSTGASCSSDFPSPPLTLETGTTSVWELSKREESLGSVPGQVSTVTTRPGATWGRPGGKFSAGRGAQAHVRSPHTAQAHLHFLTAQAQLAGSLLKEGHGSPCGHRVLGLLCFPGSPLTPGPGRAWRHIQRGADPKCTAASSTHSTSETPAFRDTRI